MERKVCPYLGRPDDGEPSLDFPSEGNFCHQAYPPASVSRKHQSGYCLTGQHVVCPVFLAQASAPPPAELASPPAIPERTRPKLGHILPLVVALIVFLASTWFGVSQAAARMQSLIHPSAASGMNMQIPVTGLFGSLPQTLRNVPPPAEAVMPSPQSESLVTKECPLPPDWEPYTVQPNDSIFRISILRNVSREELLDANCLGSQAVLTPGSILYVPILNPEVIATAIPQPTLPHWSGYVNNPAAGDSASEDANDPKPLPPTEAPVVVPDDPTSIPPTAVPPTQAPVVVQNKPDPTKDKNKPANVSPPPDPKKDKGNNNNKDDNKDDKGGKKGKGGK